MKTLSMRVYGKLRHKGFESEAHHRRSHACGRQHAWRVVAYLKDFATLETVDVCVAADSDLLVVV